MTAEFQNRGTPERADWLSALADGQADAVDAGCEHWRDDARARRDWHLYHLIGDTLRSDELATRPARDAAFVAALRARLEAEPPRLVPRDALQTQPALPSARARLGWRAPAAVAAGFVAVAGVLVATRGPLESAPDVSSASLGASSTSQQQAAAPRPQATVPSGVVVDRDRILRNAQLDEYLRAHQAARGGVATALPGGLVRNAEHIASPAVKAPQPVMAPQPGASR